MDANQLKSELTFKAVRSSGAGGQHVNKVATKIELSFHIESSLGLAVKEKELLLKKLSNRLTKEGFIQLSCGETRSQHRNKEEIIRRFFVLLEQKILRPKVRRATKPTRGSIIRKSEKKQKHSLKKALRKKPKLD